MRHHRAQFQTTELHIGAHTEQALCTADQTRVRPHRHVTRFDEFHDFVLLSLVAQFELLRVEVESRVGVVVEVHVHLVAHLTVEREVHFFVKVKAEDAAVAFGQRGVVGEAVGRPDFQFGRSLSAHTHPAGAEDFFGRPERKLHIAEVELVFAARLKLLVVTAAEIVAHRLFDAHATHLVARHVKGHIQPLPAEPRAVFVRPRRLVVEKSRFEVLGVLHVARMERQDAARAHRGAHDKGHHRLAARTAERSRRGIGFFIVLFVGGLRRVVCRRTLCRSGCFRRSLCCAVFAPVGALRRGRFARCVARSTRARPLVKCEHTQGHRPQKDDGQESAK